MYLVLDKDNVILYISETLGYQENGNVLVDEGRLAIAAILVKEVKEVAEVPAGIEAAKYCYTAGEGFTENPSYI
ncbi:hypothetical protein LJC10_05480, partial [Selenomonadales bacterium OttesenSCG-928-I06]|nr:hypothetical protein [Selenomonadales bacterium OttesenSCG-928-I06]